jgi:hypothetical protein
MTKSIQDRAEEDIAEAERHIAAARQRIVRQEELLESLRRDGHGTRAAEALLKTMRDSLETLERVRKTERQVAKDRSED